MIVFIFTSLIESTWGADVTINKTNPKSPFLHRVLLSKSVNFTSGLVQTWH